MRTDRQADRHDEVNSRFSQFCEKRLIKFAISPLTLIRDSVYVYLHYLRFLFKISPHIFVTSDFYWFHGTKKTGKITGWGVTPCSLVQIYQPVGSTRCLQFVVPED
jgi:hypothetical protein